MKNLLPQQRLLAKVLALALICFTTPIKAQTTNPINSNMRYIAPPPPERGSPTGRQQGGASRGDCPATNQPLTAIVPAIPTKEQREKNVVLGAKKFVWGRTTAQYPTFWFYLPYSPASNLPVEFVLQDSQGNYVYKTSAKVTQTKASIVKFTLPATGVPLETGKWYHWYFLVDCGLDVPLFVEGWVQRVAISPALARQLKTATPRTAAMLYATNGIWYDAITILAQLRSVKPKEPTLLNDWFSLLRSVGLDVIAHEPLGQCCSLEISKFVTTSYR